MHSLPCAGKRAPIELDLEKLTVSSRKKKSYNFLVGTSSSSCVLLAFCTIIARPCWVVNQRLLRNKRSQKAVAGGLIRLTVLSYMYNTQTILLAFPCITIGKCSSMHNIFLFRFNIFQQRCSRWKQEFLLISHGKYKILETFHVS